MNVLDYVLLYIKSVTFFYITNPNPRELNLNSDLKGPIYSYTVYRIIR